MHPMEVETLRRIEDNMGIHIGVFDSPYPVSDDEDFGEEEDEE